MKALSAASMVLAALVAGCSERAPPATAPADAAAALATVTVERTVVPREMSFDGIVEAVNQATVSAQTSGRVLELPFDVGDYVEKGAVIVRIRDAEQRARLSSAQATLAEARAHLAEAILSYDRMRDVYAKKLVAKAQLDRADAELKAARARAASAEAAVREAGEGAAHTVVHAPYSGIVVARHVEVGESVTVGRPLMTGLSLQHLRIVLDIPQHHIGPLRKHKKARALLADGRSVEVSDLRIPPAADPVSHSFRVLAGLRPEDLGADAGVFPGTLVKVAFVSGEQERVLLPAEALVRRGELTAAYVVDSEGRVALRYLSVATAAADGRTPVLAGLEAGARVATDVVAAARAHRLQAAQP